MSSQKVTTFPVLSSYSQSNSSSSTTSTFSPSGQGGGVGNKNEQALTGFASNFTGDFYSSRGRFGNGVSYWDITATSMQTSNFVSGVSGCQIKYDGSVEFTDGVFRGTITAVAGTIGGWVIDATTIHSDSITLDSANETIEIGSSEPIRIDGANKEIESDNYVSGAFGSGFHLDEDLFEVGNIACRGLIRTAVFQKSVTSVMGGNFVVLDGDVLDADMTV